MKRWRPENSLEECAVLRGRERLSEQNHVLPDHFKGGRPGSIKKMGGRVLGKCFAGLESETDDRAGG